MDGTKINGIVSAVEGNLKLKIIPVILRGVGNFADKLGDMSMCLTTLLSRLTSLDEVTIIYGIIGLLGETGDLFLS